MRFLRASQLSVCFWVCLYPALKSTYVTVSLQELGKIICVCVQVYISQWESGFFRPAEGKGILGVSRRAFPSVVLRITQCQRGRAWSACEMALRQDVNLPVNEAFRGTPFFWFHPITHTSQYQSLHRAVWEVLKWQLPGEATLSCLEIYLWLINYTIMHVTRRQEHQVTTAKPDKNIKARWCRRHKMLIKACFKKSPYWTN